MSASRKLRLVFGAGLALLLLIQVVPYGRNHVNPPSGATTAWDKPSTADLAQRACFDCHSNQTTWPWYSSVAPLSWRIQNHVNEGRASLNFSAFDPASEKMTDAAGEAGETVTEGSMPPFDYLLAHPEARLTPQEKQALAAGLNATFATFAKEGGHANAAVTGTGPRPSAERNEGREPGERTKNHT